MSSTASPQKSLQTRALEATGKIRYLPEIVAWESIRRGMQADDDLIRRTMEANHKLIYGESGEPAGRESEMGDIVLGDIRTEHHYPAPPAPPAPEPKKPMGLLPKLAIGTAAALGIASPIGAALLLKDALKTEPPPAVVAPQEPQEPQPPQIITEPGKTFDWRVGDPIIE